MAIVASAEVELRASTAAFERDLRRQVSTVASKVKPEITPVVNTGQANNLLKGFSNAVSGTEKSLQSLGFTTRDVSILMGAGLAGGVAFAARSIAGFVGNVIESASALREQESATTEIFDANSGIVRSFAESAEAIGLSETAALKAANSFGAMFTNLGTTQEQAAELSVGIVALAQDISSLLDLDVEQTQQRIAAALRGETEAAERLNINIRAERVEREALSRGIVKNAADLTEGQRVLIRYLLALEDTDEAQGNFLLTADGVANSQRQANAEWENAKASLGQGLQVPATIATQIMAGLASAVGDVADGVRDLASARAPAQEFFRTIIAGATGVDAEASNLERALSGIAALSPLGVFARLAAIIRAQGDEAANAAVDFRILAQEAEHALLSFNDFEGAATFLADEGIPALEEALEKANERMADSTRQVADAERGLARTIRDTTERVQEARERLVEVEEQANQNIRDAQEGLAQAYLESQERVADAQREAAERVADAQKSAADAIEAANERVLDSSERLLEAEEDLGRVRIDVARNIAEAEAKVAALTNRRRETVRQQRLREIAEARDEVEEARKRGAEQILTAEKSVQDARERLAEDESNLAETRIETSQRLARAQEDSARQIADAQEDSAKRIATAQQALVVAQQQAGKQIEDAQKSLARTTRDAAETVRDAQARVAASHETARRAARDQERTLDDLVTKINEGRDALTPMERELLDTARETDNLNFKLQTLNSLLNSLSERNVKINLEVTGIAIEGGKIDANIDFSDPNNPKIVPRQHGGPFSAGDTLLVGEAGPEVVRFRRGGHVDSNRELVQAIREAIGGGAVPVALRCSTTPSTCRLPIQTCS